MGIEWPTSRLEDLTELIVDCPHSTPKWRDGGEVVLRSQNIRNGRLDLASTSYTDHDGYLSRVKRAVPQAEDLVFTREAPMGEVCMIPHGVKCCMGQRMVLIRTKRDLLSPHYLLYLIQSPFLQHQISWNEGTGTTVSNIRIPNIKAFEIPIPPLPEQKAIAHILGSLDDKIELNRRMNATLEGMAQALFKSWFVDFDPVIDNALAAGNPIPEEFSERAQVRRQILEKNNGDSPIPDTALRDSAIQKSEGTPQVTSAARNKLAPRARLRQGYAGQAEVRKNLSAEALAKEEALANGTTQQGSVDHPTLSDSKSLFPAAFEYDEELGPIPEGWEVKRVKDFGSVVCGKTPSKSNADYYGDDIPFIKIPDMHRSAWITETTDGLSFAGANSQAKKQIPAKSISVSCIATVGKVVITSEASHTNQQINSVIPNAEHSQNYLYFCFLEKNKELHDLASGGSATLNLNTGIFSKIKLLSPPATTLELYHGATNPLFEKMLANDRESQSLTELRDTLLPKLISGGLRIDESEKMIGEQIN